MKVKLLTSRGGVERARFKTDRGVVEQDEAWTQAAGEIIDVDAATGARMIEDGQAEAVRAPKPKAEKRPKREKAEKRPRRQKREKATAEPKAEKAVVDE